MLKLIIEITFVYVIIKFVIAPLIQGITQYKSKVYKNKEEYTDYEEIE